MDYAYIIKSIRELKAFVRSILNHDQQAMLQFHQTRLINPKDLILHDIKHDNLPKFDIPNERWSQRSIVKFEKQVNKIIKQSENRWQISYPNASNISELVIYQEE